MNSPCCRIEFTFSRRGIGSVWKNSLAGRPGGWWARWRTARFATSLARFPGGGKSEISKSISSVLLTGPGFRARLFPRSRSGGGDSEEGLLVHLQTAPGGRAGEPADPEPGAVAGVGDQAVHGVGGIHGRLQRLAALSAADDPATGLRGEAILSPGVGRPTGASISRWTASTDLSATS